MQPLLRDIGGEAEGGGAEDKELLRRIVGDAAVDDHPLAFLVQQGVDGVGEEAGVADRNDGGEEDDGSEGVGGGGISEAVAGGRGVGVRQDCGQQPHGAGDTSQQQDAVAGLYR